MFDEKIIDDFMKALRKVNDFFAMLQDKDCPEDMLLEGLKVSIEEVQLAVSKSPAATEKVLLKALDIPNFEVRTNAASNKNATECVLLKALNDPESAVKKAAIRNPSATENVLLSALKDDLHWLRFDVVENSSVTEKVLLKALDSLRSYDAEEDQLAIIESPAATKEVYAKALSSGSAALKRELLTNPKYASEWLYLKALEDIKNYHTLFIESEYGKEPKIRSNSAFTTKVLSKALKLYPRHIIARIRYRKGIISDAEGVREYTVQDIVYRHPNATEEFRRAVSRRK